MMRALQDLAFSEYLFYIAMHTQDAERFDYSTCQLACDLSYG